MRKIILFVFLIPVLGIAQTFKNVQIDIGSSFGGPEEPAIAISLTNPDIMMAGANIKTTYLSNDGGLTWERREMSSRYGVYGDPCIISTDKGKFLYFHLSLPKGQPYKNESFLDRIVCQPSKKNGRKFKKASYMGLNSPKDQDKEWAVYDVKRGRTYVTWTQFDKYGSKDANDKSIILGSYSDNDGKSWSEAVVLSRFTGGCIDDDNTTEGAVPAVGLDGEAHVAWALDEKIYFTTYTPGYSIPVEKEIAHQYGGWVQEIEGLNRTNGMPVTMSDLSNGPNHGAIYVCWSDQRNGELNTDIFLTKSIDGGNTWSEALRVNNDATATQQFLPWMTIDQTTGYVYIVFYDRRNYEDAQTDVYLAVSKDGGATFENIKISESPFTPSSRVFFGDYNNISAHDGIVRPIWTRYENGKLSIWTAIIDDL